MKTTYPPVNQHFDPGSHRGWKISFFRVYCNLPEDTGDIMGVYYVFLVIGRGYPAQL